MMSSAIELITCGYFERWLLEEVRKDVEDEFRIPVFSREGYLDLSASYNASRKQYDGNELLKELDKIFGSDHSKTMGLFSVDLYIPILTHIFGQAFLNGRTGIASIYRLSNERYGMESNKDMLRDRFRKEVIHELGHTFGLIHCNNPVCVMRSSTYVEDIDQKSHFFCSACRSLL